MRQAKILEQHLKLCQYAFALAVAPGLDQLPRRERMVALQALEKKSKAIPTELMISHSFLFATELMGVAQSEEMTPAGISNVVESLAIWKGLSSNIVIDDWKVESPSIGSLLVMVNDQHKLLPDGDDKAEVVKADLQAALGIGDPASCVHGQ